LTLRMATRTILASRFPASFLKVKQGPMRFVCDSCRAQYMISDDKVGAKGVKVRCKKCGYVILVRRADSDATQVAQMPQSPSRDSDSTGPNPLPPEPGTRPGGDERPATNGAYANGHGGNGAEGGQPVSSFGGNGANGLLGGVEDDEIGAVFDQVLKSGPQKIETGRDQSEDVPLGFDENDDLSSTRVVSADALRKLAQQSEQFARGGNGESGENGAEQPAGEKPSDVPENDWFVAVDDQQQGPLTLEKLKDLWDRGEVGPDSLCWRAGYSDWTPLSEVADLKSVLAPKPSKPVIASSPALVGPASGAVVTVPVETSFNSGGMSQSIRTEMPVSMAAAPEGATDPSTDTGSWQPSAASALASLVKEEMSALSKPATPSRSLLMDTGPNEPSARGGGLLDLPSSPGHAPAGSNGHAGPNGLLDVPLPSGGAASHAPAAASSAFSQAPYPSYAPAPAHHGVSRGLIVALGVVAVLLVATIGTVLFVFTRPPAQPATSPQQVAKVEVPMPPPPAGVKETPPAPAAAPSPTTPGAAAAGAPPAPVAAPAPPVAAAPSPATPAPVPTAVPTAPSPTPRRRLGAGGDSSGANTPLQKPGGGGDEGEVITGGKKGSGGSKDDDEFDSLFGKPGGKTSAPATTGGKPKTVYVPGEAGGGSDVKETLGQADVLQTVTSHKGKFVDCVNQQKAKQPGLSGKLVMKWTILPSGKVTNVQVQSDEFKSTYMANCMTILIKGMTFPKHKVQGEPITFPFAF